MARRLLVRGRGSPSARLMAIAAIAATVLVLAAFALAPSPDRNLTGHRPSSTPNSRLRATRSMRWHAATISLPDLAGARSVARRFLVDYLRFVYGQAAASSVRATTPALLHELRREHAVAVPTERPRHPRVISLTAAGRQHGVVRATALVDDGGIASYAVRVTLRETRSGWLAASVDGR